MQEGLRALGEGAASRQRQDRAYFLDLLGDSQCGLGRYEAAIEAYRQAAEEFRAQGAQCSYALCLFKIADGHLSLGEPWHALGYLEACLPLLRDLGLTRHETLAREQLDACQAELARARLLGEGRAGQRPAQGRSRPALGGQARPGGQASRNNVAVSARSGLERLARAACRRQRKHVLSYTLAE